MKFFKIIAFLFFISVSGFAQIPPKAEDISPILIGETLPDLQVKSVNGVNKSIKILAAEKPTILVFYRGGWCPFCTKQLSGLGEAESEILKLGYQIVAISPDKPSKLAETSASHKINYQLYSDSASSLAKAMGLVFQAPNHYLKIIDEASGGLNTALVPVPSIFILNDKAEVQFEYINPNYRNRMSSKLLIAVLKGLN